MVEIKPLRRSLSISHKTQGLLVYYSAYGEAIPHAPALYNDSVWSMVVSKGTLMFEQLLVHGDTTQSGYQHSQASHFHAAPVCEWQLMCTALLANDHAQAMDIRGQGLISPPPPQKPPTTTRLSFSWDS